MHANRNYTFYIYTIFINNNYNNLNLCNINQPFWEDDAIPPSNSLNRFFNSMFISIIHNKSRTKINKKTS
jgi:hypothetical protein